MNELPIILSQWKSPVDGLPFDLSIYAPVGGVDATPEYPGFVRRRFQFKGISRGQRCNFPVEITGRHPTLPDYVTVSAVVADNVYFEPHGWTHIRDLEPI
jgi:hypothetical protein